MGYSSVTKKCKLLHILEDQLAVLSAGTVRFDWITRTVAQTNLPRIERLMEQILEFEYHGKHRKKLAPHRTSCPGLKYGKKEFEVGDGALEAKRNKSYPRESLLKRMKL